jgi:molybdopterin molybdotransferase
MPEFLRLLPPDEARSLLLSHLPGPITDSESIGTVSSLGRVTAEDIIAPHPLPEFPRSTMDGYAVRARDTFGATDLLPAYLNLVGEVPMGDAPSFDLQSGQCALIHTGGMLPDGADAVVMLEYTQIIHHGEHEEHGEKKKVSVDSVRSAVSHDLLGKSRAAGVRGTNGVVNDEIEIMRAVAEGENVIRVGEDVTEGTVVLPKGRMMRPAEIGGLMALGIVQLNVIRKIRVGLISSGDEVVYPSQQPRRGQVRDVNAYTLFSLVVKSGGEGVLYGIVPDQLSALREFASRALMECDVVLITAGSSASTRDMTAVVIDSLGAPGVLVHGINTRPGKPTILGVCDGKAVIGLPGNPVSALVNGYLFVVPVIEKLLGLPTDKPRPSLMARLTVNIASQAGREDWIPVKLTTENTENTEKKENKNSVDSVRSAVSHQRAAGVRGMNGVVNKTEWRAEPIFGKSNLIFTLAAADGLLRILPDATGVSAGEIVEVVLL